MNQGFATEFGTLIEELAAATGAYPSKALATGVWKVLDKAGITDEECRAAITRALDEWEKWHAPTVLRALALNERARRKGLLNLHPTAPPPRGQPTPEWINLRQQLGMLPKSVPEETPLHEKKAKALTLLGKAKEA
jgi:hypothetical protein